MTTVEITLRDGGEVSMRNQRLRASSVEGVEVTLHPTTWSEFAQQLTAFGGQQRLSENPEQLSLLPRYKAEGTFAMLTMNTTDTMTIRMFSPHSDSVDSLEQLIERCESALSAA
jgi:hypothetical protein